MPAANPSGMSALTATPPGRSCRQRVLKAKVDEARKKADDRAAELSAKTQATADKSDAHGQEIQSDWDQHREDIRRRIDDAKAAEDLETTERRAEWADARDAVDFAANAIDEAEYAMLEAILARKDVSVRAEACSERSS